MTESEIRNWLGKYFLVITLITGGYILLFAGTKAMPGLSRDEAWKIFQIIIPVLVGQLTIIFKWFGNLTNSAPPPSGMSPIPTWVVKGPPIGTSVLLFFMLLFMIIGNNGENQWGPTPDAVSGLVTFVVSVLNATTIFVVAGYFGRTQTDQIDLSDGSKRP